MYLSNKFQITSMMFVLFIFSVGFISFAHAQQVQSSPFIVEIPVPKDPMEITLMHNGLLYVPSFTDHTINIIDTKTNKISQQIYLENNEQAMTVLPIPEHDKIYVPIFEVGKINVYSMENNSLEDVIVLPESIIMHEAPPSDEVQEDTTIQTGIGSLDYNPKNMLVYAADYNSHVIYVIDVNTNVIVETLDVARHPYSVKVDPSTDTVLVSSLSGNAISFIKNNASFTDNDEPITHQIVKVIKSQIGPWGMDIDPENSVAYITNRGADILTVVDIKKQEIIDEIPLKSRGQAVAVDSINNEIYVGYYQQEDIILKINGTDRQVLSIFDPEAVSWDMEFNSQNNILYASLKDANKIISISPDVFVEDTENYNNEDAGSIEEILSTLDLDDDGCKEGFEEIVKQTTDEPVCVKPNTVQKLIERGWAKNSIK